MTYNRLGLRILFYFIGLMAISPSCFSQSKPLIEHVVLISLDGAAPEIYLNKDWDTPNLKDLRNNSVFSVLGVKSVFPSLTYPAHATMITGVHPGRHRIHFNGPFDGNPGRWYWYYEEIKVRTLWDELKEKGKTSGAVMWPTSIGAPIDYNFPEIAPEKYQKIDRLDLTKPHIIPQNLLEDVENDVGRKLNGEDLTYNYGTFRESKTIGLFSNFIIKNYKPDFTAVHFVGIDHMKHLYGTKSEQVKSIVGVTDSLVGTVLQSIKDAGIWENTAIIIVGDHGHVDIHSYFRPNTYLKENGWLTDEKNWKAKFVTGIGSAFLYLKNSNDVALADSIYSFLLNTEEYKKGYFNILSSEDLCEIGANQDAFLALFTKEGIYVHGGFEEASFEFRENEIGSTHGFLPEYQSMNTVFMISGPGIKKSGTVENIELTDISPLVSRLLGLDFGALREEISEQIFE